MNAEWVPGNMYLQIYVYLRIIHAYPIMHLLWWMCVGTLAWEVFSMDKLIGRQKEARAVVQRRPRRAIRAINHQQRRSIASTSFHPACVVNAEGITLWNIRVCCRPPSWSRNVSHRVSRNMRANTWCVCILYCRIRALFAVMHYMA